jgi:Domain of unknown function (DUF4249)
MKKYHHIILSVLIVSTLTSCLEEVQIPTRLESAFLVVDGGITDEKPPYTVRLSYSGNQINATDINLNLTVSGAKVYFKDDLGDSTVLYPSVYERGVYRTEDPTFRGKVGRSYSIKIILEDGKEYVSKPEKMQYCPPIDSLTSEYRDIPNQSTPDGYQVYLDTRDPANILNYYRWVSYGYSRVGSACGTSFCGISCKGGQAGTFCWVPRFQTGINILSDNNINGNPIRQRPVFFSPVYAPGKHLIEVAQYAITRESYQFWKLYEEQSTRTGTILDPLPAPIQGNVYEVKKPNEFALGYFEVAGVSRKRIIIYGRYDESAIFLNTVNFLPTRGGCSLPFATCDRPEGWPKD